jgi:alkenylglycerophosphocholine hydrolase
VTEAPLRGRAWLVLAAAGLAAYALAAALGPPALRVAVKPLPAAALALWARAGADGTRGRRLAFGLGLCAVADLAIEASFTAGLGVFLLAHLAYLSGFLADCRTPALPRALPAALYGLGFYGMLAPTLGPLRWPVAAYSLVLCAMVWRAAARVGRQGRATLGELAGLVGAVLFAASDSVIAWNRFGSPLSWAPLAIMPLYWAGQAGIAWSARRP